MSINEYFYDFMVNLSLSIYIYTYSYRMILLYYRLVWDPKPFNHSQKGCVFMHFVAVLDYNSFKMLDAFCEKNS